LQEDLGPSLNRVIIVALQRNFSQGSISISYAQADARDRLTVCRLVYEDGANLNTCVGRRLAMASLAWPCRNFAGRC
jgi:hypothetical protein